MEWVTVKLFRRCPTTSNYSPPHNRSSVRDNQALHLRHCSCGLLIHGVLDQESTAFSRHSVGSQRPTEDIVRHSGIHLGRRNLPVAQRPLHKIRVSGPAVQPGGEGAE